MAAGPSEATASRVLRRAAGAVETARANRQWWDCAAHDYQTEHGGFLGAARFVWGPEGLDEADARLLGDVGGRRVLELGCGAAQCSRWLLDAGAHPVALDLSAAQLREARAIDARRPPQERVPLVQADAARLPFAGASFDLACSAYGALPFVADVAGVLGEVARVLRPGGRFVASLTHPVRWCFPDDPGPAGLVARDSYWDRTPYVEEDDRGRATYVEHHRTLGDLVRAVVAAGLELVDLVEPEWPDGHDRSWGGWSPLRGRVLPGTVILVAVASR
jgi:SAM-dependent methyltransferase